MIKNLSYLSLLFISFEYITEAQNNLVYRLRTFFALDSKVRKYREASWNEVDNPEIRCGLIIRKFTFLTERSMSSNGSRSL